MGLYDCMYLIPKDQYRPELHGTSYAGVPAGDGVRGDVNESQINNIDVSQGGTVVIRDEAKPFSYVSGRKAEEGEALEGDGKRGKTAKKKGEDAKKKTEGLEGSDGEEDGDGHNFVPPMLRRGRDIPHSVSRTGRPASLAAPGAGNVARRPESTFRRDDTIARAREGAREDVERLEEERTGKQRKVQPSYASDQRAVLDTLVKNRLAQLQGKKTPAEPMEVDDMDKARRIVHELRDVHKKAVKDNASKKVAALRQQKDDPMDASTAPASKKVSAARQQQQQQQDDPMDWSTTPVVKMPAGRSAAVAVATAVPKKRPGTYVTPPTSKQVKVLHSAAAKKRPADQQVAPPMQWKQVKVLHGPGPATKRGREYDDILPSPKHAYGRGAKREEEDFHPGPVGKRTKTQGAKRFRKGHIADLRVGKRSKFASAKRQREDDDDFFFPPAKRKTVKGVRMGLGRSVLGKRSRGEEEELGDLDDQLDRARRVPKRANYRRKTVRAIGAFAGRKRKGEDMDELLTQIPTKSRGLTLREVKALEDAVIEEEEEKWRELAEQIEGDAE